MIKTIIVIGAESGIGLATALAFQQQGHTVWVTARDQDGIQILMKDFPKEQIVELDLINSDLMKTSMGTLSAIPQIDVLICNAGIGLGGPVSHIDVDGLRDVFQVNVFGHLEIIQRLLPKLEQAQDPRIIWTGSAAGYFVRPLLGGYASSKFAVSALCDALRVELMGRVHVSLIAPGRIKTAIWKKGEDGAQALRSQPGVEVYESAIDKLLDEAKANQTESPDVEIVVKAMHHAAFASRPKGVYRIGPDAKLAFWLKWLFPSRFVDWLLRKLCW